MWSGESVMPVSTPHSMYVSVIHRQPMAFPYLLASARAADDDAGKALCSSSRVSCYRSVVRVASGDNLLLSCKRGLRNNWVNKRKSKGRRLSLPYSFSENTGAKPQSCQRGTLYSYIIRPMYILFRAQPKPYSLSLTIIRSIWVNTVNRREDKIPPCLTPEVTVLTTYGLHIAFLSVDWSVYSMINVIN